MRLKKCIKRFFSQAIKVVRTVSVFLSEGGGTIRNGVRV